MHRARLLALAAAVICGLALPALATVPSFAPTGDGPAYLAKANGTTTSVPTIAATYLDGDRIDLDGYLDEPVWDRALTGWGFRQADPNRFAPASVATTFKILYDDDAIYIGMACWENDMADVASYLSRRDQIETSDLVSIYIDPYLDRTTGYNFRVNPEGVQQDSYLFDNGNRDENWNAVWEAEVSRDDRGWYVEVRIPFSQVRFKPASDMIWGLQVYRWLHGRGEDTGWVNWDRDQSGFISNWGTLTGLRDVENPRKLEILPYVVTRHTDPAEAGDDDWKRSQSIGADFKYGLTSNLTLNVTTQPDFGQVEADPSELNLSPFETWYDEKRPFFIEGARFFQHPDFNLFYSRRIGTGDPNARIRGAAKITGKIGDMPLAVLAAATDVAVPGKAHNPLVDGRHKTYYGLLRAGKEFDEGKHRINLMGTAVYRDEDTFLDTTSDRLRRNGYSGGVDFELNFDDRMYRAKGSAVGTLIDPHTKGFDLDHSDELRYGTGGRLEMRKLAGDWRGGLAGKWEHNKLDPNDMGFLSAPDEKIVAGDLRWVHNADGDGGAFNAANISVDGYKSWLYAGNGGYDAASGDKVWSYEGGHRQSAGVHLNLWGQFKSFHQAWVFGGHTFEGTNKHATRHWDDRRGPLMTTPTRNLIALGGTTDWRKPFSVHASYQYDSTTAGTVRHRGEVRLRWNQSEHFSHSIEVGVSTNREADQWLDNFENDGAQAGVTGIGDVDYVFSQLDQRTYDITLRSSVLFDRDRSLQIYIQPFLTYGDYSDPRWLATPDSYDLRPYDLAASDYDFDFGAVNVNVVYRWEYRPGSTIFLVWTHTKGRFEEGFDHPGPGRWDNGFDAGFPFRAEPENTLLAKFSYWFSI